MGLVVGVTLVTTFASGLRALQQSVGSWDLSPEQEVQTHQILSTTTAVMIAIVVISAVISAVGFVSTMSLTVIQRRREIGLLRTLGLTRRQVRRMITLEAAALSGTAVAFGIALGLVFGSVGAQSLVGCADRRLRVGAAVGHPRRDRGGRRAAGAGLRATARPPGDPGQPDRGDAGAP